jgi:predicted metal-dependent hydrolase
MAVRELPYQIRFSSRRKKTLTAFRENGRLIVVVPSGMDELALARQLPGLVDRFVARERASRPPRADSELTARARQLWDAHLRAELGECPQLGVRWSDNQRKRWGSNTISTGEIRISSRLRQLPGWVIDAVLVHELVHFSEPRHTPRFHRLSNRYPLMERAAGFLDALEHIDAHGLPPN